jgi:hypothetical protein
MIKVMNLDVPSLEVEGVKTPEIVENPLKRG